MKKLELKDDGFCFVCGKKNRFGLKIDFTLEKPDKISCEFTPQKQHQGYANIVHGGIIGLILDEAMVQLLWKQGKPAVTADFQMRLREAAYTGEKLNFCARITKRKKRLIHTEATCCNVRGGIIAHAQAKCVLA